MNRDSSIEKFPARVMHMSRVLVACEFSGMVRDAFIREGHDAISVDLLPSESDFGLHVEEDIFSFLERDSRFDLMIFHWPCTYLSNSGSRWLYEGTEKEIRNRWEAMYDSAENFRRLLNYEAIPKRVGENPRPHKWAREMIGPYSQSVQPWMFGHGEIKETCLWLRNVKPLEWTSIASARENICHREAPGNDRWKRRSRTLPGIAKAFAKQFL